MACDGRASFVSANTSLWCSTSAWTTLRICARSFTCLTDMKAEPGGRERTGAKTNDRAATELSFSCAHDASCARNVTMPLTARHCSDVSSCTRERKAAIRASWLSELTSVAITSPYRANGNGGSSRKRHSRRPATRCASFSSAKGAEDPDCVCNRCQSCLMCFTGRCTRKRFGSCICLFRKYSIRSSGATVVLAAMVAHDRGYAVRAGTWFFKSLWWEPGERIQRNGPFK